MFSSLKLDIFLWITRFSWNCAIKCYLTPIVHNHSNKSTNIKRTLSSTYCKTSKMILQTSVNASLSFPNIYPIRFLLWNHRHAYQVHGMVTCPVTVLLLLVSCLGVTEHKIVVLQVKLPNVMLSLFQFLSWIIIIRSTHIDQQITTLCFYKICWQALLIYSFSNHFSVLMFHQ